MKSQSQIGLVSGITRDTYAQIISGIQKHQASTISVPQLSKLLGVKSTTLNARFRRQQTALRTIGRTSFVPVELALNLAALHKYALLGWPTLQEASYLTGVKAGTIKARCEKGRLEGYRDLTKRLRINPAALENLAPRIAQEYCQESASQVQRQRAGANPSSSGEDRTREWTEKRDRPTLRRFEPFDLGPAAEPYISIITPRDYGLEEAEPQQQVRVEKRKSQSRKNKYFGCLSYDPDRPFSISECAVGQSIRYGHHAGTILKVIHDPFSPKILARFPDHEHPLMKEVLLTVEKGGTA